MTDQLPEKRNWFHTFAKVVFCITACVLLILTIMANMGGNSDALKSSVEQFFSDNTGYTAHIKTLNRMSFFPSIAVDFEDMDLLDKPTGLTSEVHIDRMQMSFSFWDIFVHNGKVKTLNVMGLSAVPGAILGKAVNLKTLAIVNGEGTQASLKGEGTIGADRLEASLGMLASGEGSGRKYKFDSRRPLAVKIGDVALASTLQNADNPYLSFEDFKLSLKDKDVITGKIDISKRRVRELTINGTLEMADHKTLLRPDLILDLKARTLAGTIAADNFDPADFGASSSFAHVTDILTEILALTATHKTLLDDFFAKNAVTLDLKGKTAYQGPLVFKENRLAIKAK